MRNKNVKKNTLIRELVLYPLFVLVCRDGALGFGMCCGGGSGWHTQTGAQQPEKTKGGTLRVPW